MQKYKSMYDAEKKFNATIWSIRSEANSYNRQTFASFESKRKTRIFILRTVRTVNCVCVCHSSRRRTEENEKPSTKVANELSHNVARIKNGKEKHWTAWNFTHGEFLRK